MMDEELRQTMVEVREMKQMCGNINMKLTNIVTQRGQDWKKKLEAEYQRGLDDAWEAARKVIHLPEGVVLDLFTDCYSSVCTVLQVFLKYEGSEVIEKLKAYEEKQKADDEIKVGDVVMIKQFKHPENHLFVVTKVSDESVWGVEGDGSWNHWAIHEVIKTDKHFDIVSILEDMRND